MKIRIFLFVFPFLLFAENGWVPEGFEKSTSQVAYAEQTIDRLIEDEKYISAHCRYPIFPGTSSFIEHINHCLANSTVMCADEFIQNATSSEIFDEEPLYALDYALLPVYSLPNFISIYGYEFQHNACVHGWTHYTGKNFWNNNGSIIELSLDDLFLPESQYRQFLLQHCENFFRETGYGYYFVDSGITPELESSDLNTFVLTKQGLMIVFPSSRVGGWADGPDTITIPYQKMKHLINPNGPLASLGFID
jgi:hypothetical protein